MLKRVFLVGVLFALLAVSAPGATNYVSTNGLHVAPFSSWATAATNIQIALDQTSDGDTVLVGPGTFPVGSALIVSNGVTLLSSEGRESTAIQRIGTAYFRILQITNTPAAANAVVDGFTLTGGRITSTVGAFGAGLWIQTGLFRNGKITNCWADSNGQCGGAYMSGGVVSNCVIAFNKSHVTGGGVTLAGPGLLIHSVISNNISGLNASYHGGGISSTHAGAVVEVCHIVGNQAGLAGSGGGVYMTAGTNRNCVIERNSASRGGGVIMSGGTLLNATIVNNMSSRTFTGSGLTLSGGSAVNCIVWGNRPASLFRRDQANTPNVSITGGAVTYSLMAPLAGGAGNRDGDPLFVDVERGNYRLLPGSPALDAGSNRADVVSDFAGTTRPLDATGTGTAITDMGAHEMPAAGVGPLRVGIQADTNEAIGAITVVFTAVGSGADTNLIWYGWDFDGDGTAELQGPGPGQVSRTFGLGFHTIALTASNSSEEANCRLDAFIRVAPPVAYVSPEGTHHPPFTNWVTAATNIQDAVDRATGGTEVRLSAGAYPLTSQVVIAKSIWLHGVGTNATFLFRKGSGSTRLMLLNGADAVVEHLALTNGYVTSTEWLSGAGVYLAAGTLRNCWIYKNYAANNANAGGIDMQGGMVSNCLVAENRSHINGGGGILSGGLMTQCRILGNLSGINGAYHGGGIYVSGCIVRNCLIEGNVCGSSGTGGGVRLDSGLLESCTITGNKGGSGGGGGLYVPTTGSVTNTIIFDNTLASGSTNSLGGALTRIGFSCAPELTHDPTGTGNRTNAPVFRVAGSNYGLTRVYGDARLAPRSLCIDSGTNQSWMTGSTDLDGNARIRRRRVDLGAYETRPPDLAALIVVQ